MEAYIVWKNRPPPVFEEDSIPLSEYNIADASDDNEIDSNKIVKIVNDGGWG